MSAADHPAWIQVRAFILKPSFSARLIRAGIGFGLGMIAWRITGKAVWFMLAIWATTLIPWALVWIVDLYLRVQFSLQAMLLAILTLQLPIMLFFTAESGIGIGLGISLLLIWLLVFGAYIKLRLAIAKEDSAERAAFETRQDARSDAAREPV